MRYAEAMILAAQAELTMADGVDTWYMPSYVDVNYSDIVRRDGDYVFDLWKNKFCIVELVDGYKSSVPTFVEV